MFPILFLLLIVAFFLFVISISYLDNNMAITYLSAAIFLIVGMNILINGFYELNNLMTQAGGGVLMVVGLYMGLVTSLDSLTLDGGDE